MAGTGHFAGLRIGNAATDAVHPCGYCTGPHKDFICEIPNATDGDVISPA